MFLKAITHHRLCTIHTDLHNDDYDCDDYDYDYDDNSNNNMDQLMKLAKQAGMTEEQGKAATGGIFGLLKQQLSDENYSKISSQFPGADAAATEQDKDGKTDTSTGGGLFGAAMGALGGSGSAGGSAGGIAGLIAMLASKGVTPKQLQEFLPLAAPHIKKMTGVDVSSMLGTTPAAAAPTPAAAAAAVADESGEGSAAEGTAAGKAESGGNDAMNMLGSLTGGAVDGEDAKKALGQAMGMFGK